MVFLTNLVPLALIGAMFALALAFGMLLIPRSGAASPRQWDITPSAGLACLLGAALARICVMYVLTRNGLEFFCSDEPCRLGMAWNWSNWPFAFAFDGIWLTGNFCYFGLLMKWLGNPALALQVGVLLGHMLTVSGAYLLAWTLSGRHWLGAVGSWLVAFMFTFLWIGSGPLVEGLMTAMFMIGLALAWRLLQTPRAHPWRQWLLASGAAFALFAVTTLHYVGWMAMAVLLPLLLWTAWRRRGELGRTGLAATALIAAASALFPLLWVYWSWRRLGGPFIFLANQAGLNKAYHVETYWGLAWPAASYARCLIAQAGMLLPLALVGQAWRERGLAARRFLTLFILLLLGLMTASVMNGGISAGVFRNSAIMTTSLVLLAALSLHPLEAIFAPDALARRWIKPLLAVFAVPLFLAWAAFNIYMGNRYEQTAFGHRPHTAIALGAWLQQEVRKPDTLRPFSPASRIGFYQDYACPSFKDYLAYKAGCPERLIALTKDRIERGDLKGLDYVISELPLRSPDWRQLLQITPYTIYQRITK